MIDRAATHRKSPQLFEHDGGGMVQRDNPGRGIRARRRIDIGEPGHVVNFHWTPVPGATAAEVTEAMLSIGPDVAEEVTASAPFRADKNGWVIDVPAGKRVRGIGLSGFRQPGGKDIIGPPPDGPPPDGSRIAVAFPRPSGGFEAPRFTVPPVSQQHSIPPSLTGASFNNGALQLSPSVEARQVRIALVTGKAPAEFAEQSTQLGSVRLVTHSAAHDVKVTGPDGATLWASPQFDPDGPDADISLVQALSTALSTAVAAGGTPTASVTIHATAPANAWLAESAAHGKLIREVPGVSTTAVDAAPAALALAPPYAAERPSRVIADLRIKYAGVRLVSDYSDLVPAAGAPAGRIVGMAGQERALPPEALRGQRVARLGLRGIASEPTELAVELVDALDGKPLGRAAVLQCAAGPMGDLWAELPEPVVLDRAALVRVRANTGRFLWADGSAGVPSLKIAVADPDPGGRPVRIGDDVLATMAKPIFTLQRASIPARPFVGAAPVFASELFVTIELADLRLEYDR